MKSCSKPPSITIDENTNQKGFQSRGKEGREEERKRVVGSQ
jgi:hypothetical protein